MRGAEEGVTHSYDPIKRMLAVSPNHLTDELMPGHVEAARRLTRQLGFHLVAEDLGGGTHRSLVFEVATGEVYVRQGDGLALQAGGRVP